MGWSLSQFQSHETTRSISAPPGWIACPSQGLTPSIKLTAIHLYTWVERFAVKVKCLTQEHNIMSLARAQTWTTR